MLENIKFIFQLRGFLSGYKTYIAAAAGLMAVIAQFLTGDFLPFLAGEMSAIVFLTERAPGFLAQIATLFSIGALRAGMDGNGA